MITRVSINNFKKLTDISIDLSDEIIFAGPNNSGKTTAIQALAVWRLALTKWLEKRDKTRSKATLRTGVAISRPDFTVLPLRDMKHLWRNCEVQDSNSNKIRAEILIEGNSGGKVWKFGLELEYAGPEQIYCRPMRIAQDNEERMPVPEEAKKLTIVHLPPLSGLQRNEDRVNDRSLKTRISEGRAGDILRNLLLNVSEKSKSDWEQLKEHITSLFQVELLKPNYLSTGEIVVEYFNGPPTVSGRNSNAKLDLGMGGSGFHQVLLLLAFLYDQAGSVLMFDEPDAHLEIIRQRDVYNLLRRLCRERDAQLIISTHSEALLDSTNYAKIFAFLGKKPHPLASEQESSQLRKSLVKIRSSDYLQAQERNSILYVEDYTDIYILREWSRVLEHKAFTFLSSPFYIAVGNIPSHARDHFNGLRSAHPSLKGVLLLDNIDTKLFSEGYLIELMWDRKEIENYLLVPSAIIRLCEKEIRLSLGIDNHDQESSLFEKQVPKMKADTIELLKKKILEQEYNNPLEDTPFLKGIKASEVVLEPFFKDFFKLIGKYNTMRKGNFYRLAAEMTEDEIHPEILDKLNQVSILA